MKKTISKLKKELDKWFSLYIRLRESTLEGVAQCFTCNKIDHYKNLQNGHFQSRRHHSTRWSEVNCQTQCIKCNLFFYGEQFRFAMNLDAKYGEGTAQELEMKARQTKKMSRIDYEDQIVYYKNIVNKLILEKHIE